MYRHGQVLPYENDEVVLYMDEVTGTNVTLQPMRKNRVVESSSRISPVGSLNRPKAADRPAKLLETDNDPERNERPSYGPEVDDLEPKTGRRDGDGNESDDDRDGLVPSARFPGPPPARYPFDVNIYQQKKTLAQGMMDLALISANANQFRYVLQSKSHPYYLASLAMIGTSLFLQIVVGIGLIWNSTYNVKKDAQVFQANKANNWTVIGIFLVTILNVFVSSFGVAEPSAVVMAPLKNSDNLLEIDATQGR